MDEQMNLLTQVRKVGVGDTRINARNEKNKLELLYNKIRLPCLWIYAFIIVFTLTIYLVLNISLYTLYARHFIEKCNNDLTVNENHKCVKKNLGTDEYFFVWNVMFNVNSIITTSFIFYLCIKYTPRSGSLKENCKTIIRIFLPFRGVCSVINGVLFMVGWSLLTYAKFRALTDKIPNPIEGYEFMFFLSTQPYLYLSPIIVSATVDVKCMSLIRLIDETLEKTKMKLREKLRDDSYNGKMTFLLEEHNEVCDKVKHESRKMSKATTSIVLCILFIIPALVLGSFTGGEELLDRVDDMDSIMKVLAMNILYLLQLIYAVRMLYIISIVNKKLENYSDEIRTSDDFNKLVKKNEEIREKQVIRKDIFNLEMRFDLMLIANSRKRYTISCFGAMGLFSIQVLFFIMIGCVSKILLSTFNNDIFFIDNLF